jgi:LemA protein
MEERENQIIEDYVSKMLEVQKERFEKPLSLSELKEIAFSVGMSESDWLASQEVMAQHLKTGQAHLKNKNWQDAALELKQAVAINPYQEDGLYGLAIAYHELYKQSGRDSDRDEAKAYADRALKNEDKGLDSAAIALLNSIRDSSEVHEKKKKTLWMGIAIAAAAVVGIILLVISVASSSVSGKASALEQEMVKVEQTWGQVENVYQRRESLIPQIINISKSASKYDQSKLDELQKMQKSLNAANRDDYRQKQEDITKMMTELMGNMEGNAQTMRDIQVQVEGSENRIRVEWKKYNDAVAEYNNSVIKYNDAIKSFPANMLGYKAKEKIKVEIKK